MEKNDFIHSKENLTMGGRVKFPNLKEVTTGVEGSLIDSVEEKRVDTLWVLDTGFSCIFSGSGQLLCRPVPWFGQ